MAHPLRIAFPDFITSPPMATTVIGYRNPLTTRVVDPVEDGDLKSSSFPGLVRA